jgi:hypothetical protein
VVNQSRSPGKAAPNGVLLFRKKSPISSLHYREVSEEQGAPRMTTSTRVSNADGPTAERIGAITRFGLTERQARFLATVMFHSGVFVGRQYAAFAGITHGQKVHEFIEKLVAPSSSRRFSSARPDGQGSSTFTTSRSTRPSASRITEPPASHDRPGDRAPDGPGRRARGSVRHLAGLRTRAAALLQTASWRHPPGR